MAMVKTGPARDHVAMDPQNVALVASVFVAAGLVKGVSGMGLPTLSMALLGLFMPPAAAAALMVLPSLATNLSQCTGPYVRTLAQRLWPMWVGLVVVTVFSPTPDLGGSGAHARLALGLVLTAYGAWGLSKPELPDFGRQAVAAGAVAGALSGGLTAATGVFVMPLVPYLQSLRLQKEEFIQALGLSFTIATLALVLRLGRLPRTDLAIGFEAVAIATAAAFFGLWAGGLLRRYMQPATFQRGLYMVFVLLGAITIWKAL